MSDDAEPVVVVVRVPTPRFAPRWLVERKMRSTIDLYGSLPGLTYKIFTIESQSGDFGGIYHWVNRGAADAWFDDAWFERVRTERGSEPDVRFFPAPLTIDNVDGGTPATRKGRHVATLVQIPTPAGITDDQLRAGFAGAEAEYRAVPGLLRKHFIITDDGAFGGVYLWADRRCADAWFDEAWGARVVERYGRTAVVETFDAPILLPTWGR